MNKLILSILLFLGYCFCLNAQKLTVQGTITDESNEPLFGVRVSVKGSTNAVSSDLEGKYSIELVADSATRIAFFYIGYQSQEVLLLSRQTVDVKLMPISETLDELVVVGYSKSSVKELTGATAQVRGEVLEKMNVARVDQALQGKVAGVTINTNSGSPGGGSSIRIRGLSTFGDNDPLILVDGVVYDSEGLNALNPSDIKSINVLKDATAGIYGVRAANGVILIETKSGSYDSKPSVEFSAYYGVQQTAKKLDLLNATEYATIKNQMFAFGGQAIPFNNTALGVGTNWQDSVFQDAPIQNYNLSMSGGTEQTKYSLGVSYFNQDGIVGGSKSHFERFNARVNFSTKLAKKLTLNSVLLYTHENRNGLAENGLGSVLYNTINAFPNDPVRLPNGQFSYLEEVSDIINPVAQIQNAYNDTWVNKFVGKEEIVWDISKMFKLTNRFNYNFALVDNKSFFPLVWYGPGKFANSAANADLDPVMVEIADSVFIEKGAAVSEGRSTYVDLSYEAFLSFENTFKKKHKVKALAGFSLFHRKGENVSGYATNIPNNSLNFADISASTAPGGYLNNTSSFEFTERLLSGFLKAEYAYNYKYIVSALVRMDGSSKFGKNKRYGFFPAVSAAWLLSEEDFFKVKCMDYFKLRLSYGVSGNDQIANFAYRGLLNGEGTYTFDDVIISGVALGRAANPDLKWETTQQFNAGIDITLFGDLDFTTNFFWKNTNDLLFQPDVSAIIGSYGPGGYPPIINAGNVNNMGVEVELAYGTKIAKALNIDVNFNFTYLRNVVTAVPDGVDYLPGVAFSVGGNIATRFEKGFPIGYFHGFQTDGIFQNQAEIDNAAVVQEGAQPGDFRFVDVNGDGVINFSDDSDKKMLGSPIPDFTMGLGLNIAYKGIDLSCSFYAALGQEIIRNYERQQPYANQLDYVIDRWIGEGTSNVHPVLTTAQNRNNVFSDYYVEDGSFLRLRNLQVGYTLPSKWTKKIKMESFRIYVAVNNLFTLTNYQGFDPDIGPYGGVLSSGVDFGFYPQARTIMGGINVKF